MTAQGANKRRKSAAKARARETVPANDNAPRVQSVGLDLNRYTLDHIIPGAVECCDEGIAREIKAERDTKNFRRPEIWCAEVEPGVWETVDVLPYGLPKLRVHGNPKGANGFYQTFVLALLRARVHTSRFGDRGANKFATQFTFMGLDSIDERTVVGRRE